MNRKIVLVGLLLALIGTVSARVPVVPQNSASGAFEVSASTLANCPAQYAVQGLTGFCPTGDLHIYACPSTATTCATATTAWVCIAGCAVAAAGVTSVSVNGGTPQTGPVALTIPSKVTVTLGPPPVMSETIQ